jgi:methylphosphotriester-DNA--protein-cysteine methyltransferase
LSGSAVRLQQTDRAASLDDPIGRDTPVHVSSSELRRSTAAMVNAPRMRERIAEFVDLRRARDMIDWNYAQPLDVPAMARTAHMSPSHFARRYRRTFGETPYQHLVSRRIERAQALLRAQVSRSPRSLSQSDSAASPRLTRAFAISLE